MKEDEHRLESVSVSQVHSHLLYTNIHTHSQYTPTDWLIPLSSIFRLKLALDCTILYRSSTPITPQAVHGRRRDGVLGEACIVCLSCYGPAGWALWAWHLAPSYFSPNTYLCIFTLFRNIWLCPQNFFIGYAAMLFWCAVCPHNDTNVWIWAPTATLTF